MRRILIFILIGLFSRSFSSQHTAMNWISKAMKADAPLVAVSNYHRAAKAAPSWSYPHLLLGELYYQNFLYLNSIQEFKKALVLGIDQKSFLFSIHYKLATLYTATGKISSAKKEWNIASKLKPKDRALKRSLKSFNRLTNALKSKKTNLKNSIKQLQQVVRYRKNWFFAVKELGKLYLKDGQTNKTLLLFHNALRQLPIQDIGLTGDFTAWDRGNYIFRRKDNSGLWKLPFHFLPGSFKYHFKMNATSLKKRKEFIDPHNPKSVRTDSGFPVNWYSFKTATNITFSYQTIPFDPCIDELYQSIKKLRLSVLTNTYPKQPFFGESLSGLAVPFHFYAPRAYSVWIVGSFNHWGEDILPSGKPFISPNRYWPLQGPDKDGYWNLTVHLSPGIYHYKYLVNEQTLENVEPYQKYLDLDQFFSVKDPEMRDNIYSLDREKSSDSMLSRYSQLKVGSLEQIMQYTAEKEEKRILEKRKRYGEDRKGAVPVRFTLNKPEARSVWLIGDFNDWGLTPYTPYILKKNPTTKLWEINTFLVPGKHSYKFLIDNQYTMRDPVHPETGMDDVGYASQITVPGEIPYPDRSIPLYGEDFQNGVEVTFSYFEPKAKSVYLCGSFNAWGGTAIGKGLNPDYYYPMINLNGDGNWTIKVKLKPGKYEYKFVVDETAWLPDPAAGELVKNPYASENSVVIINSNGIVPQKVKRVRVNYNLNLQNYPSVFHKNSKGLYEFKNPQKVWIYGSLTGGKAISLTQTSDHRWTFSTNLEPGEYRFYFKTSYRGNSATGYYTTQNFISNKNWFLTNERILIYKKHSIKLDFDFDSYRKIQGIYYFGLTTGWHFDFKYRFEGSLKTGRFSFSQDTIPRTISYRFVIRSKSLDDQSFFKVMNHVLYQPYINSVFLNDIFADEYQTNPFNSVNSIRKLKK